MNTYIQVRLALAADTVLVPAVLVNDDEWAGEVTAKLELGTGSLGTEANITFNYGWETPANVLASIDNLTTALGLLRAMVENPVLAESLS